MMKTLPNSGKRNKIQPAQQLGGDQPHTSDRKKAGKDRQDLNPKEICCGRVRNKSESRKNANVTGVSKVEKEDWPGPDQPCKKKKANESGNWKNKKCHSLS